MRLLNTKTLKLESFIGYRKPKYAILSHTWGHDEVLFEDIQSKSMEQWKNKAGAGKVLKSAEICAWHGIAYIWIDTCCIDKSSSSELSEAINSMFEWYLNSLVCYAYLSDIFSNNGTIPFKNSWWFTRGWTLQELLAPAEVQFFDKAWSRIGERSMLAEKIRHITGIDEHVLTCRSKAAIMDCSIHTKMVWASRRNTTREEDRAYSLMGLFDVNMPLLYGEGGAKAFQRLQDEIIKRTNDQTILLHSGRVFLDHLARSPHDFTSLHKFVKREGRYGLTFQNTRDGTDVSLGLSPAQDPGSFWGIITAYFGDDPLQLDQPALALRKCGSGALYERKDKAIYRVRLSDKGQMEVVNRNGERVEVLPRDSVRREVVRLGSSMKLRVLGQEGHIRIVIRPIVHKSGSPRYEHHALCPQVHRAVIFAEPPDFLSWKLAGRELVAYVGLQSVRRNLGSPKVGILIFRYKRIFPYLVDIRNWLGEKGSELNMHTLDSVAAHLSTLPAVTKKYENPDESEVRHVIEDLEREYDRKAGTSIVISNGVQFNAWIREHMFFEDIVYHLHVAVGQQSDIQLENMGRKDTLVEKPGKKRRRSD